MSYRTPLRLAGQGFLQIEIKRDHFLTGSRRCYC